MNRRSFLLGLGATAAAAAPVTKALASEEFIAGAFRITGIGFPDHNVLRVTLAESLPANVTRGAVVRLLTGDDVYDKDTGGICVPVQTFGERFLDFDLSKVVPA